MGWENLIPDAVRTVLCPKPENISAPKQSEIVSVLGQLSIFCPRPKNISIIQYSTRKKSEMLVSVLETLLGYGKRILTSLPKD